MRNDCLSNPLPFSLSQLPASFADTLELKTEKQNAHSDYILSVGFNHDGSQIVSGSSDKTIKVWDAGYHRRQLNPRTPTRLSRPLCVLGSLSRAQGGEAERPQRLHPLRRFLSGRQDDRLWLRRPHDQSLGRGCAPQKT